MGLPRAMNMINVTKPYLPPLEKYNQLLERIYSTSQLTNGGPLLHEFKERLEDYLGVKNILPVANGTLALQVACRLLELDGNVATSAFSFAATASSLRWERLSPIFVDVDKKSLNIDTDCLEKVIKSNEISAILAVHVFGNPCDVEKIESISKKYNLKVVYDAAHAFGCQYKKSSILSWGEISTLSFHATKLFHTVEGGALIIKDDALYKRAERIINFGYNESNHLSEVGINAKMSEFHAAMGLCLLDNIDEIISRRIEIIERYKSRLDGLLRFQEWHPNSHNNGAYMPVLLESNKQLNSILKLTREHSVHLRQYFHPCLSEVDVYLGQNNTPVSSLLSQTSLCLPLYYGLEDKEIDVICQLIIRAFSASKRTEYQ